jgi:hypothetical protein
MLGKVGCCSASSAKTSNARCCRFVSVRTPAYVLHCAMSLCEGSCFDASGPSQVAHDNVTHHPLGGASYYFQKSLVRYLNEQCNRPRIAVHVGTQPNANPHIGNILNFAVAFAVGAALKRDHNREVSVILIYVDTAPAIGQDIVVDGVKYQKSLRHTGDLEVHKANFLHVFQRLSALSGISYECKTQAHWRRQPTFPITVQTIVKNHEKLGRHISPETQRLGIRAACPQANCGLCDKQGVNNVYEEGRIIFKCPSHGDHVVDLSNPADMERLEFNTPLRNLARVLCCSHDSDTSWILLPGGDYAGFYQEQLLWRLLDNTLSAPIILYAPLIVDWSGSKLSKSMYVKEHAYKYLKDSQLAYMIDFEALLDIRNSFNVIYAEACSWIDSPYKLFRSYSIEYLHAQLLRRGLQLQTTPES